LFLSESLQATYTPNPRLISSAGTTRNSNQRKIVSINGAGHWIFYTQVRTITDTRLLFSLTGEAGTWSSAQAIFTGISDLTGQPAFVFNEDSASVCGRWSNRQRDGRQSTNLCRKGTLALDGTGTITWNEMGHYDGGSCNNTSGNFQMFHFIRSRLPSMQPGIFGYQQVALIHLPIHLKPILTIKPFLRDLSARALLLVGQLHAKPWMLRDVPRPLRTRWMVRSIPSFPPPLQLPPRYG